MEDVAAAVTQCAAHPGRVYSACRLFVKLFNFWHILNGWISISSVPSPISKSNSKYLECLSSVVWTLQLVSSDKYWPSAVLDDFALKKFMSIFYSRLTYVLRAGPFPGQTRSPVRSLRWMLLIIDTIMWSKCCKRLSRLATPAVRSKMYFKCTFWNGYLWHPVMGNIIWIRL